MTRRRILLLARTELNRYTSLVGLCGRGNRPLGQFAFDDDVAPDVRRRSGGKTH